MGNTIGHAVVATAGAFAAGKVMDKVTTAFYERQSDSSKHKEESLRADPMPTVTLVRRVGEMTGRKVDDETAEKVGMLAHSGFGVAGGPVASLLHRRTGLNPFAGGLAVALGMSLLVDEGLNYVLGLVAPAPEWPAVSHVRGVAGHLAYGLVLGTAIAAADFVFGD